MKCHYLYAAAILICAGAIGAEEIPVPEKLKPHVLYRNGFDNAASLRDPSCKWKPRINNSEIRAGGITGSGIAFAPRSIGWQISGKELSFAGGRTLSVWFKQDKPLPDGTLWLTLLDSNMAPPSGAGQNGWLSLTVRERGRNISQPGIFVQAYRLPGCSNFHAVPVENFNQKYPSGQWNHAVIACNGKTASWYLNGKLLKQHSLETALSASSEDIAVSFGRCIGTDSFFDEFIVFDTMLDEATVQEYYDFIQALLARKKLL